LLEDHLLKHFVRVGNGRLDLCSGGTHPYGLDFICRVVGVRLAVRVPLSGLWVLLLAIELNWLHAESVWKRNGDLTEAVMLCL